MKEHKYRILSILALMIMATVVGFAGTTQKGSSMVPSHDEMEARKPTIYELTKGDIDARKAKKKTPAETAEKMLGYIGDDINPVDKFLLRQMAFKEYVLGAAFDKADELYSAVRSETGIEYAIGVAGDARKKMLKPAAKTLRVRIDADEKTVKDVIAIKARLVKSPKDKELLAQLALAYVACCDWESALPAFRDAEAASDGAGVAAKVAAWELSEERSGDYDAAKVADFWWMYAKGKTGSVADSVKVHAAAWYQKALALNLLTGTDAMLASQRIKDCEALAAQAPVKEHKEKELYMIVDLAKTGKSAISYLADVPKKGWSDEYKMNKIVLRRIDPGSFEYMPGKSFKITKPFYIGVFEMTQKQYEMTMKVNPSAPNLKGDSMRPVGQVGYIDIRGSKNGLNWPKDNKVDDDSYLGKLRKKFGLEFDLPTEVQWEYACRAGTTGDFNVEGVDMVKLGKCADNGGLKDCYVKVGSFMPNAWGLYDMHGNVWERCLDRGEDTPDNSYSFFDWNSEPKESETDPRGPAVGTARILRGGGWCQPTSLCRSSARCRVGVGNKGADVGFRLACPAKTGK